MNDDSRPLTRTPIKIPGGWIRTSNKSMRPCSCGCGGLIMKGEPYVDYQTMKKARSVFMNYKLACWERKRGAKLKVRPIVRSPYDRPAKRTVQQRMLERDNSSRISLHLNTERTNKMLEIMAWAGHARPHAILYAMIDAGHERWRKRRETNTLPAKPPPLPPRHYGPHLVKVEGLD